MFEAKKEQKIRIALREFFIGAVYAYVLQPLPEEQKEKIIRNNAEALNLRHEGVIYAARQCYDDAKNIPDAHLYSKEITRALEEIKEKLEKRF